MQELEDILSEMQISITRYRYEDKERGIYAKYDGMKKGSIKYGGDTYHLRRDEDGFSLHKRRTIDDMTAEMKRFLEARGISDIELDKKFGLFNARWKGETATGPLKLRLKQNRLTRGWRLSIAEEDTTRNLEFPGKVRYTFRDGHMKETCGLTRDYTTTSKSTTGTFYGSSPGLTRLYDKIPSLKHDVLFSALRSFGDGLLNGALGGTILSFLGPMSWYFVGANMSTGVSVWFGEWYFTERGKDMVSSNAPPAKSSELCKELDYRTPLTKTYAMDSWERLEREIFSLIETNCREGENPGDIYNARYLLNKETLYPALCDDNVPLEERLSALQGFLGIELESGKFQRLIDRLAPVDTDALTENAKVWFDEYRNADLLDPAREGELERFLTEEYAQLVSCGKSDSSPEQTDTIAAYLLLENRIASSLREASAEEMGDVVNNGLKYTDLAVNTKLVLSGTNVVAGIAAWSSKYLTSFVLTPAISTAYLGFYLSRGLLTGFAMAGGRRIRQLIGLEVYRRTIENDVYADTNSVMAEYTSINSRRMQMGTAVGNGIAFASLAAAIPTGGWSLIIASAAGALCYGAGLAHYYIWKRKMKEQFSG